MTDINKITPEHAEFAINVMEGQLVDVKAIEIKPAKLTKFVSGFANAGGGDIYVGIDEKEADGSKVRVWRGFEDMEAANAHIQAVEAMKPISGHYLASFLACQGLPGYVLKIEVPKSKDIIVASDELPYIRKNARVLPVNTPEAYSAPTPRQRHR